MARSFSFQPTSAPGREGPATPAPQPIEGQPAHAQPGGGQEATPGPFGGGAFTFLILALPLLLIFLMTRNQNKKQKQLESSLKTGDRVVTQSGFIGKIVDISERSTRVRLEIAPGVTVQVLKSAIQGIDAGDAPADTKPADAKSGEKPKDLAKDKPQEKKA